METRIVYAFSITKVDFFHWKQNSYLFQFEILSSYQLVYHSFRIPWTFGALPQWYWEKGGYRQARAALGPKKKTILKQIFCLKFRISRVHRISSLGTTKCTIAQNKPLACASVAKGCASNQFRHHVRFWKWNWFHNDRSWFYDFQFNGELD